MMVVLAPLAPDRCSRSDPRYLKAAVDRRLADAAARRHALGRTGCRACATAFSRPASASGPILTMLAAWELGADDLRALDAGCALEMVHAASLILDDLPAMDNARERRGQPATHVRFGEDVAMLARHHAAQPGLWHHRQHGACAERRPVSRSSASWRARSGPTVWRAASSPTCGPSLGRRCSATPRRPTAARPARFSWPQPRSQPPSTGADMSEAAPLHRCAGELGQAYQILDDLHRRRGRRAGRAVRRCRQDDNPVPRRTRRDAATPAASSSTWPLPACARPSPLAGYVRSLFGAGSPHRSRPDGGARCLLIVVATVVAMEGRRLGRAPLRHAWLGMGLASVTSRAASRAGSR